MPLRDSCSSLPAPGEEDISIDSDILSPVDVCRPHGDEALLSSVLRAGVLTAVFSTNPETAHAPHAKAPSTRGIMMLAVACCACTIPGISVGFIGPIAKRLLRFGAPYFSQLTAYDPCATAVLSLVYLVLRCVSAMIRIRAPLKFRVAYRAGMQQQQQWRQEQYQQCQQHHNIVAARPHLLENQRYVFAPKGAEEHQKPRRCLPQNPGLKDSCRHFASASGVGSSSSSSSRSTGDINRSYLERWAGIRGRVASGTQASLQGTGTCT